MKKALAALEARLTPAEDIFFTWLPRVFAAAILMGSAWIDDAPPLEIVALLVGVYVAVRVASQYGPLCSAAPFQNPVPSALFALFIIALLGGTFLIIFTFAERITGTLMG